MLAEPRRQRAVRQRNVIDFSRRARHPHTAGLGVFDLGEQIERDHLWVVVYAIDKIDHRVRHALFLEASSELVGRP